MSNRLYETLPTVNLNHAVTYCHPHHLPEVVHLDDPAHYVMTDFFHSRPVIIKPDAVIPEALTEMKACQVHSLLVVDTHEQVLGFITAEDMLGEKPVKIIQERRIARNEIKVRSLMTPIEEVILLDYSIIEHTKVGNVVHTLTELNQHYALVIALDNLTQQTAIRGIISSRQIAEQLGLTTGDIPMGSHAMAELQALLAGHQDQR
ncbi:MAG: CBS domain-containing protein [Legionellales bacterium]|nr:CBS domain-containing protein [Legionellales bacterium]